MKYLISTILTLLVLGLTFIDKIVSGVEEFFVGGTTYVFFEIISASILVKSIFLAILIVTLFLWLKCKKRKYVLILIPVFILWLQSGRTIAFNSQDGQIVTGWFFFKTNMIEICEENQDCEKKFYKEVTLEKLPLWRIKFKNADKENVVFIGPFVWDNYLKLLEDYGIHTKM
ncbi:hypothetical protein [Flavobacterium oreochromis]|nr:hypothetical protein [Flavobacterium oreochromis]